MSLALYRKYRPQELRQVLGQERVTKTLEQALKKNSVAHSYIFSGPRGTGKTSVARILGRAVNCEKNTDSGLPAGEPCNKCAACQRALAGQELDFVEIDAASNRGIDEIRALRQKVQFAPGKTSKKVFLIDEFHMLTKEAFNALLKTLEEPPPHAIFILATTEIHNIPATILSRAQHFVFTALKQEDLTKLIEQVTSSEKIKIDNSAIKMIAAAAEGGARDALGLLELLRSASLGKTITPEIAENNLNLPDTRVLSGWVDALINDDKSAALDILHTTDEAGADPVQFGKSLINYLRIIMLYQVSQKLGDQAAAHLTTDQQKAARLQAGELAPQTVLKALTKLNLAAGQVKISQLAILPLEVATLDLFPTSSAQENGPKPVTKSITNAPGLKPSLSERPAQKKTLIMGADDAQPTLDTDKLRPQLTNKKTAIKTAIKSDNLEVLDADLHQTIIDKWSGAVLSIKEKNISLASLLNQTIVLESSNGKVLLVLEYEFYRDRLMQRENRHLVEEYLEKELGRKISIDCRLAAKLTGQQLAKYKEMTAQKKTSLAKEVADDPKPLVKLAVDLLGGQVVD